MISQIMISPFTLLWYLEKPGHYEVHAKAFEEYLFLQLLSAELSCNSTLLVIIREAGTIHEHLDTNADNANEQAAAEVGGDRGGRTGDRSGHRAELRWRSRACRQGVGESPEGCQSGPLRPVGAWQQSSPPRPPLSHPLRALAVKWPIHHGVSVGCFRGQGSGTGPWLGAGSASWQGHGLGACSWCRGVGVWAATGNTHTHTHACTLTGAGQGVGCWEIGAQGPQEEGHRQGLWRRTAAGQGSPPGCRAGQLPPQGLGTQGHPSVGCAVPSWSSPTGPQRGGQNRVLATGSIHRPRLD